MIQSSEIMDIILSKTNTEKVYTYPGSPPRYLYQEVNDSEADLIQTVREQHILPLAQTYYYNELETEEKVPVGIVSGEMGEGMMLQPLISGSVSCPCIVIVAEDRFKHVGNALNIAHQSQRGKTPEKLDQDEEKLAKHDNIEERILIDSENKLDDLENLVNKVIENKSVGIVHVPLYILEEYENKLPEEFQQELKQKPEEHSIEQIKKEIQQADKPMFIVGRGMREQEKREKISQLAEKLGAPIATTMQMEGYFNNNYVGRIGTMGTPEANSTFFNSDIVISLGASINNLITSYKPEIIREFREKVYQAEVNPRRRSIFVNGYIGEEYDQIFDELLQLEGTKWHNTNQDNFELSEKRSEHIPDKVQILSTYIRNNHSDKTVNLGVGNHMVWMSYSLGPHVKKEVSRSGSMGEAVAGIEREENPIIVLGDGEFEMDLSMLLEAYYQDKRPNIFVINNKRLGLVTEKQEAEFDNRLTPKMERIVKYGDLEEAFPEMESYSIQEKENLKEVLDDLDKDSFNLVEIQVNEKMSPELIDIEDLPT